jgi:Protein of unknown function (DUF2889)
VSDGVNAAPTAERELLHQRDFSFNAYLRPDGLYEIDGRMTDRKNYPFPNDWRGTIQPNEALHDMRVRVVLDESFLIVAVTAETAASPFEICPAITANFAALKGERIGKGWTKLLRQKFGGEHGCTHHVELLRTLATVAFQTIYGDQQRRRRETRSVPPTAGSDPGKRPDFIGTCHALAADSEIVKQNWPEFYEARE